MIARSLLSEILAAPERAGQFYGVTVAIVTNNKDEEGLGRVKVNFPWLSDSDESYWARVLTPMAGTERGIYFLPEVEDEVLVAFAQGDIDYPYILGSLWNGKDKPPETNDDGKNNHRLIKSRSGHQIILDDTEGEEKIIIRDKTENNEITIDSKDNTMTIKAEKDITIEATGNITIKSSDGDITIEGMNLELKANSNCKIEANSGMALQCEAGVKINDSSLEVL